MEALDVWHATPPAAAAPPCTATSPQAAAAARGTVEDKENGEGRVCTVAAAAAAAAELVPLASPCMATPPGDDAPPWAPLPLQCARQARPWVGRSGRSCWPAGASAAKTRSPSRGRCCRTSLGTTQAAARAWPTPAPCQQRHAIRTPRQPQRRPRRGWRRCGARRFARCAEILPLPPSAITKLL